MTSAKPRWQLCFLIIFSCLSFSVYADSYAQYGRTIDKAFYQLAIGNADQALSGLDVSGNHFEGDVEYETLRAITLLETKNYEPAQHLFRGLAKLLGENDEANVKQRVLRIYESLAAARQSGGLKLPLEGSFYNDMNSQRRLNINFNRRLLDLPFIGSVAQWKTFEWQAVADSVVGLSAVAKSLTASALGQEGVADQPPAELSTLIAQAKALLASAQPGQAFALLQPHEFDGAGDVEFDYVMGTAAVDAGAADEAIFILSRVLNQKANHAGARLELARAYYANGDYVDAQQQFEKVLQQSPPPEAKVLSERYLVAIRDHQANKLRSLTPYVEGRIGYDSNANGATSVEQPFAGISGVSGAIQGLTLNQQSLEQSSTFLAYAGGLAYSNQFKPRYFVRAGAQLEGRANNDASFVDTEAVKGFANFEYRQGRTLLGVGLDGRHSYVGGSFNANTAGLSAFAGKSLNESWLGNAQLRIALQRYESAQDAKNSTDYTLALAATRMWAGPNRLTGTFGAIAQSVDARTAINSKEVLGAQASINFVAFDSTLFTFSAVALEADYDSAVVGSEDRSDRSYLLGFGLTRFSGFDPNLKWLFNLDATRTNSTLALYDSDGVKASVGVRYDFR